MYYYTYTSLRDAKIIYKGSTPTQVVHKNPNIHNKHIKLKVKASLYIIKHSFKSDDSKTCGSSS